ncbi:Mrp/NBP35 family ATP-binding protein [Alicyclobacillus mali]|uniref:Iron-sulfur cluster carrier protein n=1 Tax=Alicyclobacillus mali (ex Roth et al. 2021) TaxID=1123961 RepID=A0ABS0EZ95_9BACL|nr:Mrp/NBP35 family ATP-binding protein [Alicyclobacillus mali (ex Roth et al. 2021)]MBF8376360.1 Mrp/NBP35 family ATP-binding protein [Alicyclobacillus mali (ex Roth et al. 2021)]
MVTREQVIEALRDVKDPEVGRSIVELDMVPSVEIEGGKVTVDVLLTIRGCPLSNVIEREIRERLSQLEGVTEIEVRVGHMTDQQRAQFAAKVRGMGRANAEAQQAELPPILRQQGRQFLAIASGKGGVGKSTVTANLAVALARKGYRVALIDADIYGFSIPVIFGIEGVKPATIEDLIMPVQAEGVKIMSMQFFVPENTPVVWRGPMLGKTLRSFFGQVHWGDVDIVLLDLPPGTGDVALDVHTLLPQSKQLIVTTPQAAAAEVAVRAGLMGVRTNHQVIGVVENMAYFVCDSCGETSYLFGRGGGERVAAALNTTLLAEIPIANQEKERADIFSADSLHGQVFGKLADRVAEAMGLAQNRELRA